eukprot:gene9609-9770_t
MSGGGFRAATLASGWLRGLHQGDKPMYHIDDFLGEYYPPEKLRIDVIDDKPQQGSFDYQLAISNAVDNILIYTLSGNAFDPLGLGNWLDKFTEYDPLALPWTAAVKNAFLEPYRLDGMNTTVSAAGTVKQPQLAQKLAADVDKWWAGHKVPGRRPGVLLACTDPDRPYPIIGGCVFNKPGDDKYSFYPWEFTPLYTGIPTAFDKSAPPLGGGYFEPLGLHAVPQKALEDGTSTGVVDVKVLHTVPLAQMVGISSSFFAAGTYAKSSYVQKLASTETLNNWAIMNSTPDTISATTAATAGAAAKSKALVKPNGQAQHDDEADDTVNPPDATSKDASATGILADTLTEGYKKGVIHGLTTGNGRSNRPLSSEMKFADGGALENLGIMALLRRKESSLTITAVTAELKNQCNKVFGTSPAESQRLFEELFNRMKAQLKAGGASYHRATYQVQQNSFHNIPGGWQVDVLWVINQQATQWEESLPQETQERLSHERINSISPDSIFERQTPLQMIKSNRGHITDLKTFPYFTTYAMDYGNAEVHMLGQFASWVVVPDLAPMALPWSL